MSHFLVSEIHGPLTAEAAVTGRAEMDRALRMDAESQAQHFRAIGVVEAAGPSDAIEQVARKLGRVGAFMAQEVQIREVEPAVTAVS